MNIFTQFFKGGSQGGHIRKQRIMQDFMRSELEITRDLFGEAPKGGRRDFFCLDKNTWIWYEEWIDENNQPRQMTTRYVIRPTEIIKSQNGGAYRRLSIDEVDNFQNAAESYVAKVKKELYTATPANA